MRGHIREFPKAEIQRCVQTGWSCDLGFDCVTVTSPAPVKASNFDPAPAPEAHLFPRTVSTDFEFSLGLLEKFRLLQPWFWTIRTIHGWSRDYVQTCLDC